MRNSLDKVFSVLDVIASSDGAVSLKELSGRTGHHPSTLSRILANLVEIGYVRKDSYREFSLDLGLIPLGQKALTHFPLPRLANPLIRGAAGRLDVHGALAGLHRGRLVYLYRSRLQSGEGPLAED
ncbi:MAG: helix-turn-helix domain-containing protein, partial [Planctomycetota bacterium]